jgi:hypothetical protein
MVSISGIIPTCPGKGLIGGLAREGGNREEDFIEDKRDPYRMGGGAVAVIDHFDGIGHVGVVIRAVEVLSVPAHGERDLGAESINARGDIFR